MTDNMYLVGWIGWGSVEDGDLHWCETDSPDAAIEQFVEACKAGEFTGHGYDNLHDRRIMPGYDDSIILYEMKEIGEYIVQPRWTKRNCADDHQTISKAAASDLIFRLAQKRLPDMGIHTTRFRSLEKDLNALWMEGLIDLDPEGHLK